MYSQSSEQSYITGYFENRKPFNEIKFLDVGSYDPYKFSNVRRLYELGASGVMVEPSPKCFAAIEAVYKDDPRITLLNIAIGDTTDHITFYESEGDAISTTDIAHRDKWAKAGVKYETITVPIMETSAFFEQYCHGIDFVNIDTEGTNMSIFRRVPEWVWREISLLCIEYDGCHIEIKGTLVDYGFREIHRNGENIILAKL